MGCRNILIVEDDHAIRQMMKDVLEVEGYTVYTANDGSEGLEQLRAIADQPCIVLLDLMMPGTNGWTFLDRQREDPKLSSIPVIICSAYNESARSVRPSAVIDKPVRLDALLNAVQTFSA